MAESGIEIDPDNFDVHSDRKYIEQLEDIFRMYERPVSYTHLLCGQ